MLELHDGSIVRGLVVSMSPSNPVAQGFIDSSGKPYDYACRYFAVWDGVNEDPATGSAQCSLGPFWSKILGKKDMYALQVIDYCMYFAKSSWILVQAFPTRGAQFRVRLQDGRVILNGSSVTVLRGEIIIHWPFKLKSVFFRLTNFSLIWRIKKNHGFNSIMLSHHSLYICFFSFFFLTHLERF